VNVGAELRASVLPTLAPGARVLVFGIGNPGRGDDALGCRVVEWLEAAGVPPGVTLDANYQLTPEDALTLADHDVVLFVDATVAPDAPVPYHVAPADTADEPTFSTHAMSIGSVLALARQLAGREPRAWTMAIPAYGFEINDDLTPQAAANLARACDEVRRWLSRR
jgi:hydrogenase maturation protease